MQLVLQHYRKAGWKAMLRVLPPILKPVLQQITLQVAWILTSDWIKLRGNYAIHSSYITCCKTSLPWVDKTRNMYRVFCKKKNLSLLSAATLIPRSRQQPDLLQDGFDSWVVTTRFAAILQNKLHFLLPFLPCPMAKFNKSSKFHLVSS